MSKTVLVELPDAIYDALHREAVTTGVTSGKVIAAYLARYLPVSGSASEASQKAIRECVDPDIVAILERLAPEMGLTVEEAILDWKAKYETKPRLQLSAEERRAACEWLLRHAGGSDRGDPDAGTKDRTAAAWACER